MPSKKQKEAKLAAQAAERRRLKRAQLERELKAQSLKRDELDRNWRALMLQIKEPIFKQDIEIMWNSFERAYDKKDHQIAYTMLLMNIADDQFQRTVASFCDTIDTMIVKFLAELEELSKDNDRKTTDLLIRGQEAVAVIMKDHDIAETHLQLLLYHSHKVADTQVWAARGENLVKEDEERTKYSNERENLRSFLENDYNNMWEEYKAVLKAYVNGTAENQKQVRILRRKENMMADIIASQGRKIANSDGLLKRLRAELGAYESGTKQAVFRDRRDRNRAACHRLKMRMINGVKLDTSQLGILVKATDSTLEWLNAAHKKAEKILRMAAMCRKFEVQREKVLPYGSELPHLPVQNKTTKQNISKQNSDDPLVLNAISTTCGLTRMWQRVAKAEMTRRALFREKQLLLRENKIIEHKIMEIRDQPGEQSTKTCLCSKSDQKKLSTTTSISTEGILAVTKFD
ncbi:hypothetical protein MSG28_010135 [Choristoneura fumiferana]|uniref:Uncharacterized protein n=1 Tax=Choristoneura fumiferana TaxID=7141 RepID=A0ACC0KKI0_CHOFU|nr:hypothetical protein MSG28_010135 [Choristoneura fumiferana]